MQAAYAYAVSMAYGFTWTYLSCEICSVFVVWTAIALDDRYKRKTSPVV